VNSLGLAFNALSLIVGWIVYRRFADKDQNGYLRFIAALGLLGGAIIARSAEFLAEGADPHLFVDPFLGGRTVLGGLIGGWIAVELGKRWLRIHAPTGDAFAFALASGEAVGRIGCYFNGCCYGKVCSLPWAIYQHGAWRHPTQIYSSLAAAATFCFLLWLRPRVAKGQVFAIYLVLFGGIRLLLEPLRADFGSGAAGVLAMLASLGLAIAGIVLYVRRNVQVATAGA
jgi:phosphatidylglycerol:prolipoprotein diacylglycerol transferase